MNSNVTNDKEQGLILRNMNKSFGEVRAVKDVTIEVKAGEFFTLLGPSGCGKTTLLRMVAGLELPDTGQIILGGQDITRLPATKRQVNTVFQSYALFPHLTIYENVAFGLRSRKFDQEEIKRRVHRRLEMLGLDEYAGRHPHQLSGGQKQRVALARALVNEPQVLLLDEPMSALDARLRAQVQVDLRRLQRKLGQTFIMVTHDQAEALVCSDRIAVMRQGQVVQFGTPEEVYDYPRNRFVAEFLGAANLIPYRLGSGGVETDVGLLVLEKDAPRSSGTLAIRPEWIRIRDTRPEINGIQGTVRDAIYRGTNIDYWFDPGPIRVRTSSYKHFHPGDQAWLELAPNELVILDD